MHFFKKSQIAFLLINKTLVNNPIEFINYVAIFLSKKTSKLQKYIRINNHPMYWEKVNQLLYRQIYSQGQLN